METIRTRYTGNLRTESIHVQSGNKLITDAPVDNQGRGETFSPTDLIATAVSSCILTIMGIIARDHNFSIDGVTAKTTKIMTSNPRRIGELKIEFDFTSITDLSDKQKRMLENSVKTCPAALSVHPEIKQTIIIKF